MRNYQVFLSLIVFSVGLVLMVAAGWQYGTPFASAAVAYWLRGITGPDEASETYEERVARYRLIESSRDHLVVALTLILLFVLILVGILVASRGP